MTRSIFETAEGSAPSQEDREDRQIALEYLADAWNSASEAGVGQTALAHASLFAALATLVKLHGDEQVAAIVGELPERIRLGEYNLDRRLQ